MFQKYKYILGMAIALGSLSGYSNASGITLIEDDLIDTDTKYTKTYECRGLGKHGLHKITKTTTGQLIETFSQEINGTAIQYKKITILPEKILKMLKSNCVCCLNGVSTYREEAPENTSEQSIFPKSYHIVD